MASNPMASTTAGFCAALLDAAGGPLPAAVARAARRTLLNVLGTAVSASGSAAVGVLLDAAGEANGDGGVTVPGLDRTLGPYWGALAIGTAAHLDDFDDTHLATVIHPGASALATVLSLAPETRPSGALFLGAFAAGCEAQLRIGSAISPAHYDHGWHITGTCGVFGAAVAAACLLGLDAAATADALSLAATMTLGHREAFGSMTKPLHAGKAAANGVLAARLAAGGLSGPADPLGPDGVLEVLADRVDRAALGLGWPAGHRWELELNTVKTYPCGVVAHPAMDAAADAFGVLAGLGGAAEITGVMLRCNPLVPELMGLAQPENGLRSRFSARHGMAVGLLYGRAGLAEFSDAAATAPDVARLRGLITLDPDEAVPRDAATVRIELRSGPPLEFAVEHTRGSAARPLSDAELLGKVTDLVTPVLGEGAAGRIAAAVTRLPEAPDVTDLLAALRPAPVPEPDPAAASATDRLLALTVTPGDAGDAGDTAMRALGSLRPTAWPVAGTAAGMPRGALPAGPAWTAWLTAAAALGADAGDAETVRVIVSAAVAAVGGDAADQALAVAAGLRAAGLVEAGLVAAGLPGRGGWHGGTVAATVGAALAAGMLLRLPRSQLRNALGIAATQASGLRAAERTGAAPLQAGKAACNGVEAALLARAGLTGPADPLGGRRGLFALFGE